MYWHQHNETTRWCNLYEGSREGWISARKMALWITRLHGDRIQVRRYPTTDCDYAEKRKNCDCYRD